jgi:hypothetical protein
MLSTAGNHTLEQIMSVIKTIIMKTNYNYVFFINFIETRDDNLALFIYLKVKAITNLWEEIQGYG